MIEKLIKKLNAFIGKLLTKTVSKKAKIIQFPKKKVIRG